MKNKFSTLAVFFLVIILGASCSQGHDGYDKTESGLYVKYTKKNEKGRKGKLGEIAHCTMMVHLVGKDGKSDSLIFSSVKTPDFPGGLEFIPLSKPTYDGDLMEGLLEMRVGESASFIVSADSFFLVTKKMQKLPDSIPSGSELMFTIEVKDIKSEQVTAAMWEAERKKMEAKMEKEYDALKDIESDTLQNYLKRKSITAAPQESGLILIEKKKGTGPRPKPGELVTVHYTGYLLNGKKFDSSFDRNEPIKFALGMGQVIPGWDEGIGLMPVGSTAQLIIPSELAYGPQGSKPVIPPFSTLVFDVELLKSEPNPNQQPQIQVGPPK
jgi:FKBP-type peptidyl-prolyl cis-trans isomerase